MAFFENSLDTMRAVAALSLGLCVLVCLVIHVTAESCCGSISLRGQRPCHTAALLEKNGEKLLLGSLPSVSCCRLRGGGRRHHTHDDQESTASSESS